MEGKIFSYIHANGRIGAMVKISTVTDFAARTDEFGEFGKNIAMQIVAMDPASVEELLDQVFIKNEGTTIEGLAKKISKELGEKVGIVCFKRYIME